MEAEMIKKFIYIVFAGLILTSCTYSKDKAETDNTNVEVNAGSEEKEDLSNIYPKANEAETEKNDNISKTDTDSEEEQEPITPAKKYNIPTGFSYVDDVITDIDLDIRYYTDYNFVGEKIDGYIAPLAILTDEAVNALKEAADILREDGYTIRIYDAYRPQKAVDHFVRWSQNDDDTNKEIFYPQMEKAVLFTDGYISKKSRHSRGSTVDLTILDENGNEVDMGGYFDLLDTRSNYDTDQILPEQHENREYLRNVMDMAGFDSIRTEWWHFQLRDEPYTDKYFDFDIE